MHHHTRLAALALASTMLLAACGGSNMQDLAPGDGLADTTRIDILSSTSRGMGSVATRGSDVYVSLANSETEGSGVLRATHPVSVTSAWSPVGVGGCGMAAAKDSYRVRQPRLKLLGDTLWLHQPWSDEPDLPAKEHSVCSMTASAAIFAPRDGGLEVCHDGWCQTLWMSELKQVGTRLYSNAGAGINLLASSNQGATWSAVRGGLDSYICTHTRFEVIGERVLVGGECPLDFAFLSAYQLRADGMGLASEDRLPLSAPELENRNVQFIETVPNTQRVFVGVEGGLLRSDDAGRSFTFVIENPVEGNKAYPYITSFLPLRGQPDTIVVAGFDKANFEPYMAWTRDGGATWSDISTLLPAYGRPVKDNEEAKVANVTSLAQDAQGRILATMNEREDQQGRLLLVTLGRK